MRCPTILAIVAVTLTAALLYIGKNTVQPSAKNIRIALQGQVPAGPLGPENISTISLYHLHSNLWDTLITSGGKAAVARSHRVEQDRLHYSFEIDPEAKFSNGRKITANDVKDAFARIIAREESGHLNAKSVIKEINAPSDQKLEITLHRPTPSFLFLLTTPEFGVVPKEALDESGAIASLAVTSGAYLLEARKEQSFSLRKNPWFRRSTQGSPDSVEISFLKSVSAETDFRDFDFIEVLNSDSAAILSEAAKMGFSHKATLPSVSVFLLADGKMLSPSQSSYFSHSFEKNFQFKATAGLEERSRQFFPPKTFGSLQTDELPDSEPLPKPSLPLEIAIKGGRASSPLTEAISSAFQATGTKVKILPPGSSEPAHYLFTSQGMNTEHPEIELHLDMVGPYADFNASERQKRQVLEATHEEDDSKRSAIIKQVGKELLTSGKVIPLTTRSYVHVFRPERIDLNGITNYDGDIPIYKIKVLP